MTGFAQNPQILNVIAAAILQGNDVVALPVSSQQRRTARLATATCAFETMPAISCILGRLVSLPIRIRGHPQRFIHFRLMRFAVVPLRCSRTDQARTQPCRTNFVTRATSRTIRSSCATNDTGFRARFHSNSSHLEQTSGLLVILGKNASPQMSQIRNRRLS